MSRVPTSWQAVVGVHASEQILIGFLENEMYVLAPPGAASWCNEPLPERVDWRCAIWYLDDDDDPRIEIDRPALVWSLSTAAVRGLVPKRHENFIRQVMARQIDQALAFGRPFGGTVALERHARHGSEAACVWRDELQGAFPGESWYQPPEADPQAIPDTADEIPDTADELLARLPVFAQPPTSPSRGQLRRRWRFYLLVRPVGRWLLRGPVREPARRAEQKIVPPCAFALGSVGACQESETVEPLGMNVL